MNFGSSPKGQHVLAYNSSRIYVIDVRSPAINVSREFKIQRRPASACITDDANTLAVLSSDMQVDIYDLTESPPERKHSLILDNKPQTIAISSCGTVLAAAYNGGIEVSSLKSSALSTEKRAVKCDAVDALAFSLDGTQILGTTVNSSPPCTVVLTAPYYDPGSQLPESSLSAMWTTSILFPNTSRDCSHAIWLPDGEHGEPEWTFTYDRSFETFRAVRLDDLRNGTTYFTGPIPNAKSQTKLLPCTLPATTTQGELVSAGFQGKEVWIYGIPEDLDAIPEAQAPPASRDSSSNSNLSGLGRNNSTQSNLSRRTSQRGQDGTESEQVPQWQILCDKLRNNLVAGFKVTEVNGIGSVKWVGNFGESSSHERLVVTATGVNGPRLVTDEEDFDFVDGGRIALLDFDYSLMNGDDSEITIEVGTDNAEPLAEERRDLETEVAIVRRRTVAQKRGGSAALLRAATTAAGRAPPLPIPHLQTGDAGSDNDDDDPLVPRTVGQHPINRSSAAPASQAEEEFASIEEQEALDAPYAHTSPRSQNTLRRAATAAAVNRRLNPRTADGRPIEYRRADGRAEHPHESDADNWVPPPPPYQKEDPGDLPAFLRGQSVAPLSATYFPPPSAASGSTSEARNDPLTLALEQSAQANRSGTVYRRANQRKSSDATDISRLRVADIPRPRSTPSVHSVQGADIYDVSPQASPRLSSTHPSESAASQVRTISPPASRRNASGAVSFDTAPSQQMADMSPTSSAAAPLSPGSSTGPGARPSAPMLELHIPTSPSQNIISATEAEPVIRRLSNVQTWPRQFQQGTDSNVAAPQQVSGYPYTAPPSNIRSNDLAAGTLPPAPSSRQIESLNKRISQGNPRRLSGNILNPQLWMDAGRSMTEPMNSPQGRPGPSNEERFQPPDSDRPLIISTPTGVSGSHDPPQRRGSTTQAETPILAPIPRRPVRASNLSRSGGTAQQLENIYNNQPAPVSLPPHMRSNTNAMPMWMRTPSNSSRRTPNGVNRRRSRAERSAAKNMKDAKKRGWMPKKKKKETIPESAGWVDVPTPSKPKESKCVIM